MEVIWVVRSFGVGCIELLWHQVALDSQPSHPNKYVKETSLGLLFSYLQATS